MKGGDSMLISNCKKKSSSANEGQFIPQELFHKKLSRRIRSASTGNGDDWKMAEGDDDDQVNAVNAEGVKSLAKQERKGKKDRSGSVDSNGEVPLEDVMEDEEEQDDEEDYTMNHYESDADDGGGDDEGEGAY
jgi:hypothetical protein